MSAELDDWDSEDDDLGSTRVAESPVHRLEHEAAAAQRDRAYLITITGPDTGRIHKLSDGEHVLGRSNRADVQLEDDSISRMHAKVTMAGKRVMVQDLQSANGTFVNGAPVEARQLSDGDKIRIGDTTILKFSIHDQLDEQFQKQLYRAALHDDLTQAFNKKYLLDHLHKELRYALRHRTPLTLLMLDIDHFKRFNDSYGHLAGDAVLSQFGKLVAATLRAEDIFARYGGEEFAIVTRGIALESASVLAERVRRLVESTAFRAGNQMLHVTVSIGAADVRHDTMDDVTKLIAAADAALYQAKHAGRNRVALSR